MMMMMMMILAVIQFSEYVGQFDSRPVRQRRYFIENNYSVSFATHPFVLNSAYTVRSLGARWTTAKQRIRCDQFLSNYH